MRNEDDKEEGEAEGGEKRRKDVRTWEEICLLCLGGELQSVIALGTSFHTDILPSLDWEPDLDNLDC